MKVVVVKQCGGSLNIRKLLNPIFFSVEKAHPDSKRQRGKRLRSKRLNAARALKAKPAKETALPVTPIGKKWLDQERRARYDRYLW